VSMRFDHLFWKLNFASIPAIPSHGGRNQDQIPVLLDRGGQGGVLQSRTTCLLVAVLSSRRPARPDNVPGRRERASALRWPATFT
jgi:hypothetical protein